MNKVVKYLEYMNIYRVVEFNLDALVFDEKVREACKENKCGKYNCNFMCPPFTGTLMHSKERMKAFKTGLLIYLKEPVLNPEDQENYYHSADRLHEIILGAERAAEDWGFKSRAGFIAGHCRLCDPCGAVLGLAQCCRPEEARTSMEALGIDVMKTCENLGYPIHFVDNEVTWVGMLLLR